MDPGIRVAYRHLGLKIGITGPAAQAANSEIWVCNLGFFCAPWWRRKGTPGLDVHLFLSHWCTADGKMALKDQFLSTD